MYLTYFTHEFFAQFTILMNFFLTEILKFIIFVFNYKRKRVYRELQIDIEDSR